MGRESEGGVWRTVCSPDTRLFTLGVFSWGSAVSLPLTPQPLSHPFYLSSYPSCFSPFVRDNTVERTSGGLDSALAQRAYKAKAQQNSPDKGVQRAARHPRALYFIFCSIDQSKAGTLAGFFLVKETTCSINALIYFSHMGIMETCNFCREKRINAARTYESMCNLTNLNNSSVFVRGDSTQSYSYELVMKWWSYPVSPDTQNAQTWNLTQTPQLVTVPNSERHSLWPDYNLIKKHIPGHHAGDNYQNYTLLTLKYAGVAATSRFLEAHLNCAARLEFSTRLIRSRAARVHVLQHESWGSHPVRMICFQRVIILSESHASPLYCLI